MIYYNNSSFPDKIDPLIFFQDIDISQVSILEEYQRLIRMGMYDKADEYMKYHNIHGYCAALFNLIENRILSMQEYLFTKEKMNPTKQQTTEPSNAVTNYTIWEGKINVDDINETTITEEVIE